MSVVLKAGTYEFYCPVDGHKAAGMKGELAVRYGGPLHRAALRSRRLARIPHRLPRARTGDRGHPALVLGRLRPRVRAGALRRAAHAEGSDAPVHDQADGGGGPLLPRGEAHRNTAQPFRRLLPRLVARQRLHVGPARRRLQRRAHARGQGASGGSATARGHEALDRTRGHAGARRVRSGRGRPAGADQAGALPGSASGPRRRGRPRRRGATAHRARGKAPRRPHGGRRDVHTAVCTRALQYAIFRDEAPHISREAEADGKLGADATSPAGWETEGSLLPLIQRPGDFRGESSLPSKLGRDDPDEATSPLAIRTISHAAIVALAALRGVVPLARVLDPARVPLFALQGMTARRVLDRVAVVLGFAGAAWYLAARWLTIPADSGAVPLGALWSPQVLALWVCMFTVAGVLLLPSIRAIRTDDGGRRAGQGLTALAIALGGGGLALGWQWALKGSADALTAWHATYLPPAELLWVVAAAGGLQVASRFGTVTRVAQTLHRPMGGLVSTAGLMVAAIGAALAVLSMVNVIGPAMDDGGWKTAIAIGATASPIVVACYLLWPRRWNAITA